MATLRTPMYAWHIAHGARMVEFGGWDMPVQYSSIVDEHQATRTACGIFDISHMGRLRFTGTDSALFLDRLLTRKVTNLRPGAIRYSLVTNESGGILDDVLVYNLPPPDEAHLLVVNAANRQKIVNWLQKQPHQNLDVMWNDETGSTAMIAMQGPAALTITNPLLTEIPQPVDALKYYTAMVGAVANVPALISRTGYTGEDGCELIVPTESGPQVWQELIDAGASRGIRPAGLGARDTLRLEAGMPLYGHELSEDINPYEADLGFAVQLEGRTFPGSKALAAAATTATRRRVGLKLEGRRVPRENYAVLSGSQNVGRVTSGTFSPTLNCPIAMALIDAGHVDQEELLIDIRGSHTPAQIVSLPFYRSGT